MYTGICHVLIIASGFFPHNSCNKRQSFTGLSDCQKPICLKAVFIIYFVENVCNKTFFFSNGVRYCCITDILKSELCGLIAILLCGSVTASPGSR